MLGRPESAKSTVRLERTSSFGLRAICDARKVVITFMCERRLPRPPARWIKSIRHKWEGRCASWASR
jgi:hypothetical protein